MFEIERLSISLEVRTRVVDNRSPHAGGEAELESHRLDRQQQIGKNDRGVHIQNLHRLEGDLGRKIRTFTQFQDSVLSSDIPVLLHIAASLTHEPDGPDIGRPAAAGFKKAAVHGSHAHGEFHLLLLVTFSKITVERANRPPVVGVPATQLSTAEARQAVVFLRFPGGRGGCASGFGELFAASAWRKVPIRSAVRGYGRAGGVPLIWNFMNCLAWSRADRVSACSRSLPDSDSRTLAWRKIRRKKHLRDGGVADARVGQLIGDQLVDLFPEAFRHSFVAMRIQISEYNS